MPPIIGLTTYGYREKKTVSALYDHHYAIPKEYVDSVTRAGGIPLLIPPNENDWQALWPTLDGIIVTGGTDIAPQQYHGDGQNSQTQAPAPEGNVGTTQHLTKIAFGCSSTACLIQEKINRLTGRINCPIKVHPLPSDFDIGLINAPGIVRLLQIGSASFVNFRRIILDPAENGCVMNS